MQNSCREHFGNRDLDSDFSQNIASGVLAGGSKQLGQEGDLGSKKVSFLAQDSMDDAAGAGMKNPPAEPMVNRPISWLRRAVASAVSFPPRTKNEP